MIDEGARRAASLHAKTLATFGTAAGQHQTTALGSHAGTETVYTLAVQVAGLICALHGNCPELVPELTGPIPKGAARVRVGVQGVKPEPR